MRWGRYKPSEKRNRGQSSAQSAILIAGSVLCAVFFLAAVRDTHTMPLYPTDRTEDALRAFVQEHTALADAIGIDAYFPPEAVEVGAFEEKSEAGYREFVERQWSFGDYFLDALRVLLGGTSP